jgi:hypothetical protein
MALLAESAHLLLNGQFPVLSFKRFLCLHNGHLDLKASCARGLIIVGGRGSARHGVNKWLWGYHVVRLIILIVEYFNLFTNPKRCNHTVRLAILSHIILLNCTKLKLLCPKS